MREHQTIIFGFSFGAIFEQDDEFAPSKAPTRVINPHVAAWRLGKLQAKNPCSRDTWLASMDCSAGIDNETSNNRARFEIAPVVYRRLGRGLVAISVHDGRSSIESVVSVRQAFGLDVGVKNKSNE